MTSVHADTVCPKVKKPREGGYNHFTTSSEITIPMATSQGQYHIQSREMPETTLYSASHAKGHAFVIDTTLLDILPCIPTSFEIFSTTSCNRII